MAIQTAVAQCDATARTTPGSHGWEFTRCSVTVGLRTFRDREGIIRAYCPSAAHKHAVERRFGVGEACYVCGKPTDDMAVSVNLGLDRLGLMCATCQDDLEPLTQYDDEDRDEA